MNPGIDHTGIAVVFFCHDGQGNFILSQRNKNCRDEHGCWDPGGGAIDFDDRVEVVLKKEIKEEYGCEILEYEFLGYRDIHRLHHGKKTHWIALDFKVKVNKKQVKNGEPHKFSQVGWFKLDHLPSPLHSQLLIALEKYQGRL